MRRLLLVCLLTALPAMAVTRRGDVYEVPVTGGTVTFAATDGAMAVLGADAAPVWRTGPAGLWSLRFLNAPVLSATSPGVTCAITTEGDGLKLSYTAAAADVTVFARPAGNHVDLTGELTPHTATVLELGLPGRLRFDPQRVTRLISPMGGNESVGAAFRPPFFQRQPQDHPTGWTHGANGGPAAYLKLYGGPLDQKPDTTALVPLTVTAEGERLLGPAAARVRAGKAMVNRPPTRAQAELLLVDSPDGPWLSGNRLGGRGALWRIGGKVDDEQADLTVTAVGAVAQSLAASAPAARNKVALIDLEHGPEAGGFAATKVTAWRARLAAATTGELVRLRNAKELADALGRDDLLEILNPYGEGLPVLEEDGLPGMTDRIARFVRGGGNWFEVGGYPFYYELKPVRYLSYGSNYPDAFADFLELDTPAGTATVYGVQVLGAPWDKSKLFVPGRLACGGDEQGGWCERAFGTYVPTGQSWRSPVVRLGLGGDGLSNLKAYAQANGITRGLKEKMKPEVLDKFKRSVMLFYAGNAADKIAHLDQVPKPALIHFSDYLKGGFDKQYPDHLPPNPGFGTPAQLRQLADRCRELGLLWMPYTNPTWWCDGPKGPTFEREGEAPLLKRLDGKVQPERYASNTGFTITFWHPAVQAANRKTRTEFTRDYPVDVLFQDQCGARGWVYDTNPASPTPYAYAAGMISMVDEDSQTVPLSTESGWDRVVNAESQLCGLTWKIVPTEGRASWVRQMREDYGTSTWTVYPVAQAIAHDKCAMHYHDLGQFVTNPQTVSWTLGLGFGMNYRCAAAGLDRPAVSQWLAWVDRLQKSVIARYTGEPVNAFEHRQSGDLNGMMAATYGPVQVVANLDAQACAADGHELAGYGFHAAAPGVVAGRLSRVGNVDGGANGLSFVSEARPGGTDVWVFGPGEQSVAVELPQPMPGKVKVTFDGQAPQTAEGGATVAFRLPAKGDPRVAIPAELAGKAPREWPAGAPAIGVLDVPNLVPGWISLKPADWVAALEKQGLPVKRLTSAADLVVALQAGVTKWLAIVNPYGESFPITAPGEARAMLGRIRDYVNHGGSWCEVAGYSLYKGVSPNGAEDLGPNGMGSLGVPVGGGPVEAPPERLTTTATGRAWLGEAAAARLDRLASPVNRNLPRDGADPGHVTLVTAEDGDFFGGYRLEGWGYLWRIGGFNPDPEVALTVLPGTLRYLYDHAPALPAPGGQAWLWHAVVTGG